jgi:hypothetical protein
MQRSRQEIDHLGNAADHVVRPRLGRRRLAVGTVPQEDRSQARLIGTGDVLRQRVADEQRLLGTTVGAAQRFAENCGIGLARPRLFARQGAIGTWGANGA